MMTIVLTLVAIAAVVLMIRSELRAKRFSQAADAAARTAQGVAEIAQTMKGELSTLTSELRGRYDALSAEGQSRTREAQKQSDVYKDLTAKWDERVASINEALTKLSVDATQRVSEMAMTLKPIVSIFRSPQAAGIEFGEAELEMLLKHHLGESLYLRKPRQLAVGQDVVDFAMKLPDCLVPIDSKFPSASYRAWVEASGEEAKAAWRSFRDQLLKQMVTTAKYIKPDVGTTDYALLFVPSDVIYQQAFLTQRIYDQDNPIPQRALELQVFGCSTQTLLPMFGLIRLGLRNFKIAEDVKGIRSQIEQLDVIAKTFGEDWKVLRGHVSQLANHVDKLSGERGSFARLGEAIKRLHGHAPSAVVPNESTTRLDPELFATLERPE